MTYKGFLTELRRVPGWRVLPNGDIRKVGRDNYHFCPLTGVAFHLTGRRFDMGQVDAAAEAIGLPESLIDRIVDAADDRKSTKIRRDLLAIVREQEKGTPEPDKPVEIKTPEPEREKALV